MTTDDLLQEAKQGNQRALGRLLSIAEEGGREASALDDLCSAVGSMHVVGLTGSPGVGKSTLTSALLERLVASDLRPAVLAVDPSSPFTGGAILGDRVRIQQLGPDKAFVRSVASRGASGGLSASIRRMLRVLSATGCTTAIVETVGVGQVELDVASVADTVVMLLAPGWGDGIQAEKAGSLEVADIFVINKADREGLDSTVRDLKGMLEMSGEIAWTPPIIPTVAITGSGVDELSSAIAEHREFLGSDGRLMQRRARGRQMEVRQLVMERVKAIVDSEATTAPSDVSASAAAEMVMKKLGVALRGD